MAFQYQMTNSVPPGSIITTQQQADKLPSRIGTPYEKINSFVIHVNKELAKGSYSAEHSAISYGGKKIK